MNSQTFEHLHGHLLWHSRLADTISCRLDHHSKSPRAQLLSWLMQIDALMTPSSSFSTDYNVEFHISYLSNGIRTQFQVLPGKLPLGVVLEVLEVYVDVVVVTGADHLDHLKLGLILGFLWGKTQRLHITSCLREQIHVCDL